MCAATLGLDWPLFHRHFPTVADILGLRNLIFETTFTGHVSYLSRVCCLVAIYYMWEARNCLRFRNRSLSFLGVVNPQSADASWPTYSTLHLSCARHSSSSIINIVWHSPRAPWIKVNADGLAKRNLGLAACGAGCRGFNGAF